MKTACLKISALDHAVLNVADVERSVAFYSGALGLPVERLEQYRSGAVKFPSVRLTDDSIIDLFGPAMHGERTAGSNVNHLCFAVDDTSEGIERALQASGVTIERREENNFGARGLATSYYVRDPDGNKLEFRSYRD